MKNNLLTCVLFFSHTNRVRQQCHNLTIKPKGKQNDHINLHYRFFAEKISFQKRGRKPEKSSQRRPVCLLGEKSCITDWLPKPPILRRKNCRTIDEQDGILRQHGFAFGDDRKIYEKVSTHFDSFVIKGIRRYKDVIADPRGVYAFISAAGDFYYVTEKRCPFAADDVVYVTDCHN